MAKSWREIQKEKEEHERQKAEQARLEKEAKLKGLQQEVQPVREHNVRLTTFTRMQTSLFRIFFFSPFKYQLSHSVHIHLASIGILKTLNIS